MSHSRYFILPNHLARGPKRHFIKSNWIFFSFSFLAQRIPNHAPYTVPNQLAGGQLKYMSNSLSSISFKILLYRDRDFPSTHRICNKSVMPYCLHSWYLLWWNFESEHTTYETVYESPDQFFHISKEPGSTEPYPIRFLRVGVRLHDKMSHL